MKRTLSATKIAFEDRLVRMVLWGFFLPAILAIGFIVFSAISVYLKGLLILSVLVAIGFTAFAVRRQVIFQLRTSTNLVEAMSSGDYSLRANNQAIKGALADFNILLNSLAEQLAQQSLISREKQILLGKVTDHIDVAIVAVDEQANITLMNPSAERLFKQRFSELEGWPIKTLGLQNVVADAGDAFLNKVTEFEIGHNRRKVYVRTDNYFELGKRHQLIFITDIQHILRDEERLAWQKLLRVLSHEINNSLTPIASIAETLTQMAELAAQDASKSIDQADLKNGLGVIAERAHALNHFIQDYQQLTHLPLPTKSPVDASALLNSVSQLFEHSTFSLPDASLTLFADPEQLQQVLVNVVKNAQEANLAAQDASTISVDWHTEAGMAYLDIRDHGSGINNPDNIFVPFYTTKRQGSGIGLTLSRQIALNHGGDLTLQNHPKGGAVATLILPLMER